jgi:hypothetical protein
MWTAWAVVGVAIVAVAFELRIAVHAGRQPGGVDTWYYLAYADAFRARPSFKVRLPQYLLQDEVQSYPPLFPMFLSLFPRSFLHRWFWTISPTIDCLHLLLLYWLAFKITASVTVAAVSAAVYAFTPTLVADTRSLMSRSFGALLHSIAVLLVLRCIVLAGGWEWVCLALLAGSAVLLASATSATGYVFVCALLSALYADWRYVAIAGGALALAVAVSAGHLLRVARNYLQAVQYWRRNRRWFGAHPIRHSPVYGEDRAANIPVRPGFLGGSVSHELLRLVGENPFLLALPLAPIGIPPWGTRLYWWAMGLGLLAILATLLPPLRAFGPGRSYLKTAVFPTAYTIAVGIGAPRGVSGPLGLATLLCLGASIAAIAFFYGYTWRQTTERTASVPEGLEQAARYLAAQPGDGLLCLPYSYADYVCYHSGKRVLWGGHCGDLRRLEVLAPVITCRLETLLDEQRVSYVLLDSLYASPADIGLEEHLAPRGHWGSFGLYEFRG